MSTPARPAARHTDVASTTAVQAWTVLGALVAPTTLVTALMYYFGWARAQTAFAELGVDSGALGFSAQDYVLRSIDTVIKASAVALGVVLAAPLVHRGLVRLLNRYLPYRAGRPQVVPGLIVVLGAAGVGAGVAGLGLVTYKVHWPVVPLSLGSGALLIGYGLHLGAHLAGRTAPYLSNVVVRIAFAAFVVMMAFWSTSVYASARGREIGRAISLAPGQMPAVVLFAGEPLALAEKQAGVTETAVGKSPRWYRYDGFRLLVHAGGKYVLLPSCWTRDNSSRVVALPDDGRARVEFLPGNRPATCP